MGIIALLRSRIMVDYSSIPFVIDIYEMSPEARLVLSRFLRNYGGEYLFEGSRKELASAVGMSLKVTIRALLHLKERGLVAVREGEAKQDPRSAQFVFVDAQPLSDLLKAAGGDLIAIHAQAMQRNQPLVDELLGSNRCDQNAAKSLGVRKLHTQGIKAIAKQSRARRQHKLSAGGRVLLVTLLLHANHCGVVRGLTRSDLSKRTGLTKDRLINLTKKLVSEGYLLNYFPGATVPVFFGSLPTVYFINPKYLPSVNSKLIPTISHGVRRPEYIGLSEYRWRTVFFGRPWKEKTLKEREQSLLDQVSIWPDESDRQGDSGEKLRKSVQDQVYELVHKLIIATSGPGVSGHLELKLAEYSGWFLSVYWPKLAGHTVTKTSFLERIEADLNPTYAQDGRFQQIENRSSPQDKPTVLSSEDYKLLSKVLYAIAFHQAKGFSTSNFHIQIPTGASCQIEIVPGRERELTCVFAKVNT